MFTDLWPGKSIELNKNVCTEGSLKPYIGSKKGCYHNVAMAKEIIWIWAI